MLNFIKKLAILLLAFPPNKLSQGTSHDEKTVANRRQHRKPREFASIPPGNMIVADGIGAYPVAIVRL